MQKYISEKDELLDDNGSPKHIGYQNKMSLRFNKENIKNTRRIKEWDYYYVSDGTMGLCLTISNLSYAAVLSASVIDFARQTHYDKSSIVMFPKTKLEMPVSPSKGKVHYETKDAMFTFETDGENRRLFGTFKNFYKKTTERDLSFNVIVSNEPEDSMIKVTPFKNKQHFYFNQKTNCMSGEGEFTYLGKKYHFDKTQTFVTLDWGRGVLPYRSTWQWASLNANIDGKKLGINLGNEFGDNSLSSENMLLYEGKCHKLADVDIYIRKKNGFRKYREPWTFYTNDGKLELMFEPIVDRYVPFNLGFLAFIPHQVFGYFSGKVMLDSGEILEIKNQLGFSERVRNRW